MRSVRLSIIIAVTALAWFGLTARGAVIPVAYYHLGESDPGAAPGNAATVTVDSVGALNLTITGSATYIAAVSASAASHTSSTVGLDFGTSNVRTYGSRSTPITSVTDNFGVEGWFMVHDNTLTESFVLNGTGNGFGIADNLAQRQICFLSQNVGYFSTGFQPTNNVWFYAAIVDNNGHFFGYINNTTPIDLGSHSVMTPSGQFTIGSPYTADSSEMAVDEVRVFTFSPGQFSSNDLLIAPEPSSLIIFGVVALGMLLRRRRRSSVAFDQRQGDSHEWHFPKT